MKSGTCRCILLSLFGQDSTTSTSVTTSLPPIDQKPGKREEVKQMFDDIAHRYDFLNHLLSFGIDRLWRRRAVELIRDDQPRVILDVATGTGDLAIRALKLQPEKVVGVDISEQMLNIAREKIDRLGVSKTIVLETGAAEDLPMDGNVFDAALVAFGVRNFENLRKGLEEIARVLRPGAPLVVLEFSYPNRWPVRQAYDIYFRQVVPRIGRLFSRHQGAYQYLHDSVRAFPDGSDFLDEMAASGYDTLRSERLTLGIASLYFGRSSV